MMEILIGIIIGVLSYHVIISAVSKRSAVQDIYKWQDRQTDFQDKLLGQWETANLYREQQTEAIWEISRAIREG